MLHPPPASREVRRSIIEQLWDPSYYKNLYDNPSTIAQKELYLKAYGLVMLYDMISKQEKISNAYAIETANILNGSQYGRATTTASTPLQIGGWCGEKNRVEKKCEIFRGLRSLFGVLALSVCLFVSRPALAQCEDAGDTGAPLDQHGRIRM